MTFGDTHDQASPTEPMESDMTFPVSPTRPSRARSGLVETCLGPYGTGPTRHQPHRQNEGHRDAAFGI